MLHIVAICHIAVETSNRGRIYPYKTKKCFRQTAPHTVLQRNRFDAYTIDSLQTGN